MAGGRTIRQRWSIPVLAAAALALALAVGSAQDVQRSGGRVPPPRWDELPNVFFEDAFRDALVGPRPARLGSTDADAVAASAPAVPRPIEPARPAGPSGGWSEVISAEVLEDEVKNLLIALNQSVSTERAFRDGLNRQAGQQLGLLATWLTVIGQFDGTVRWQAEALAVASELAESARRARESSAEAYQVATAARLRVQDLVRGVQQSDGGTAASKEVVWPERAERRVVMQRLEQALDTISTAEPSDATGPSDRSAVDSQLHESQVIAAIGRVLVQPGMDDAGDADYAEYCRQIEEIARELLEAARRGESGETGRAIGRLRQTCDACHEMYRG